MALSGVGPWCPSPAALFTGVSVLGPDGLILALTLVVVVGTYASSRAVAVPPVAGDLPATGGGPELPAAASVRQGWASTLATLATRRRLAAAAMVLGLLLVFIGQRSFAEVGSSRSALFFWLLGLGLLVALDQAIPESASGQSSPPEARRLPRRQWSDSLRTSLVLAAGAGAFLVWTAQRSRPLGEGHRDIVVAWLLTIVATVLVVWQPSPHGALRGGRRWVAAHRADLLIAAALAVLAAVPMTIKLDSYPWAFNGDEGLFGMSSRAVLNGVPVNPFGTGTQAHPNLYFYLQAGSMALFGDTVVGARMINAILGTVSVPLAYALVARVFGRGVGVMAAVLLGSFHVHLFWGRSAQNNLATTFFLLLTLYLLDRALADDDRLMFLLTGLSLGFAQYFYVGNRLLPVAVAGILLHAAVSARRAGSSTDLRSIGRAAGLTAIGAVVAALPLYAHYATYRQDYSARLLHVSIFASGSFDERTAAGESAIGILWEQFTGAALVPFSTGVSGAYRGDPPFIGWPLAIAVAIGLAVATVRIWQRRYVAVTATYWLVVAGLATTFSPFETNRFVMASPLLCIFAAVGIAAIGRAATALLRVPPRVVAGLSAVAVVLLAGWSMHYYFRDPNQVALYSDANTQTAEYLARDVLRIDPAATVYFAGPPRMWYAGFANLVFRTPNATGISVEEPWDAGSPHPTIAGTTIFAFLPERREELALVQQWFPGGEVVEREDKHHVLLYTAYVVRPD
jgi:hypothetical protein